MNKPKKTKLGKLVQIANGSTPSTENDKHFDGDFIWITPKDLSVQQKKYIYQGERNISKEGFESCSTSLLPTNTILLSSRAPIGLLAINKKELCTNQGFKNLICNSSIYYEYLYYLLKTKIAEIEKLGTGTTFKEVSKTSLENFELFYWSDLSVQYKIAKVLSSLDDKIELNNKINEELEQMAKLLFDYWFVQFDFPNENGKPYKSSGGKMTYNPQLKREIPDGWEVKSLYDIATFTNGLALQNFRPKQDNAFLPVIKIKEMHNGFTKETEQADIAIPKEYQIQNGDILFSWSATLKVIIWAYGIGALNQHIFKVTSDQFPKSFIFYNLLNYIEYFKGIADKRKTTMGHITLDHLRTSYLSIPPAQLISKLDIKLSPIIDLIVKNKEENQQLAELRNWLLPMLMNGQVKIEG